MLGWKEHGKLSKYLHRSEQVVKGIEKIDLDFYFLPQNWAERDFLKKNSDFEIFKEPHEYMIESKKRDFLLDGLTIKSSLHTFHRRLPRPRIRITGSSLVLARRPQCWGTGRGAGHWLVARGTIPRGSGASTQGSRQGDTGSRSHDLRLVGGGAPTTRALGSGRHWAWHCSCLLDGTGPQSG